MGLPHPCLMLVTEPCDDLAMVVSEALDGGVNAVQWLDKRTRIGKRDAALTGIVAATKDRAALVANGDWESLLRHGLRKIHLPERSAPVGVVKYRIGNGAMVGKSVTSVAAAVQAEESGADYVIAENTFASPSQPEAVTSGVDLLRDVCRAVRITVVATGGVTPENTAVCIKAGASGVAVQALMMRADDPQAKASEYRRALDAAWESRPRR